MKNKNLQKLNNLQNIITNTKKNWWKLYKIYNKLDESWWNFFKKLQMMYENLPKKIRN